MKNDLVKMAFVVFAQTNAKNLEEAIESLDVSAYRSEDDFEVRPVAVKSAYRGDIVVGICVEHVVEEMDDDGNYYFTTYTSDHQTFPWFDKAYDTLSNDDYCFLRGLGAFES